MGQLGGGLGIGRVDRPKVGHSCIVRTPVQQDRIAYQEGDYVVFQDLASAFPLCPAPYSKPVLRARDQLAARLEDHALPAPGYLAFNLRV